MQKKLAGRHSESPGEPLEGVPVNTAKPRRTSTSGSNCPAAAQRSRKPALGDWSTRVLLVPRSTQGRQQGSGPANMHPNLLCTRHFISSCVPQQSPVTNNVVTILQMRKLRTEQGFFFTADSASDASSLLTSLLPPCHLSAMTYNIALSGGHTYQTRWC